MGGGWESSVRSRHDRDSSDPIDILDPRSKPLRYSLKVVDDLTAQPVVGQLRPTPRGSR